MKCSVKTMCVPICNFGYSLPSLSIRSCFRDAAQAFKSLESQPKRTQLEKTFADHWLEGIYLLRIFKAAYQQVVHAARSQKYSLGGSTNMRQNTADPCVGHVAVCLSRAMAVLSQWELIQPVSCHMFFFTRVAQEINSSIIPAQLTSDLLCPITIECPQHFLKNICTFDTKCIKVFLKCIPQRDYKFQQIVFHFKISSQL